MLILFQICLCFSGWYDGLARADASESSSNIPIPIWPLPTFVEGSGPAMFLSEDFYIHTSCGSSYLERAITRYKKWISPHSRANSVFDLRVKDLELIVASEVELLNDETNYTYSIHVADGRAAISAENVFGALYGLESFSQLVSSDGTLPYSNLSITDSPAYSHRGLMVDTGRRFFPKELVFTLLDAMGFLKLNILHLHLSDNCRFAVQSTNKNYRKLTAKSNGSYSKSDIADIISHARERGVRVVPEFDMPGHTHGMSALANSDLLYCDKSNTQLRDDEFHTTLETLKLLLTEMVPLFEDRLFHIGCDETRVTKSCPMDSTRSLEKEMLKLVESLGKTPVGWEEVLFTSKAATPLTVVNTWRDQNVSMATQLGHQAIESSLPHFYLNYPTPYQKMWTDISAGVSKENEHLVLGGEFSMWTDNYCYIQQCINEKAPKPVASWMFDRKADNSFQESILAMIFPRGIIAAGSFWNYQPGVSADSREFAEMYNMQTARLISRGIAACPVGCKCDELSKCGNPYTHSHP